MSESYGIRAARAADLEALPGVERSALALYRRLLHEVCRWAAAAGYPAVTLSTFRNVPSDASFYARHGFRALEADELGPDLRGVVEGERRRGLRMELRVIMRREAAC